jgi:hypothetical protein
MQCIQRNKGGAGDSDASTGGAPRVSTGGAFSDASSLASGTSSCRSLDASVAFDSGARGGASRDTANGRYAYFYADTNNGGIYGVPDGSTRSVVLEQAIAPERIGTAFAFDGGHLYYTVTDPSTSVMKVMVAPSTGGQPQLLFGAIDYVRLITADATALYFVETTSDIPQKTIIGKVPLREPSSGCAADAATYEKLTEVTSLSIYSITTYGDYVYWTETSGGVTAPVTSVIKRIPKEGGVGETVVGSAYLVNPINLVIDSTGLYWMDLGHEGIDCSPTDGDIQYLPTGATSPVVLATNIAGASSLAVKDRRVFFAADGSGCNGYDGPGTIGVVQVSTPMDPAQPLSANVKSPGDWLTTLPHAFTGPVQTLSTDLIWPGNLFIAGNHLYFISVADRSNGTMLLGLLDI